MGRKFIISVAVSMILLTVWLGFAVTLFAQNQGPPALYTEGTTYNLNSHVVSTSVFHWYTSTGGQLSGPWLPLEGRANWTGEPSWWQSQIKQIMAANIDVLYVHLIPHIEQQRINLFQALGEMRVEGYDVPKIAPFLDPLITWNIYGTRPDLATAVGKDEFVDEYKRFFNQYYSVNTDAYADSFIAQIDERVVLDTWHVDINFDNYLSLTRNDVESRLSAEFGQEHPIFNNGIYMVGTATSPVFSFTDERVAQFEVHEYWYRTVHNGIPAMQLKGGYWDQNIRNPGYILPRDGGSNYDYAWTRPDRLTNNRVYIESWNEYDEGSGIYAVDVVNSPYITPGNPSTDTWSDTNNPWEYIKTTAEGVRVFKIDEVPLRDSRILWHNMPTEMYAGQVRSVQVVVRNEGTISWTGAEDYKFGQKEYIPGEVLFGQGRYPINDNTNEIPLYGGIFRGRPIIFEFDLIAPDQPGTYETHWGMLQEFVTWFGEEVVATINVYYRGDLSQDGRVDMEDFAKLGLHWWENSCGNCGGADLDNDEDVDFNDLKGLADNWLQGAL